MDDEQLIQALILFVQDYMGNDPEDTEYALSIKAKMSNLINSNRSAFEALAKDHLISQEEQRKAQAEAIVADADAKIAELNTKEVQGGLK